MALLPRYLLLLLMLSVFRLGTPYAAQYTPEQLEEWFFDDSDRLATEVNEGALTFLAEPPAEPVHHHHNTLIIDKRSLREGWVRVRQCHENIDAVPRAEVVFSEDRSRTLKVESHENIERAWIEGNSVQLANVGNKATLCISVESKALFRDASGHYVLRNGPFMRRFLDGFYPMRVSMDVRLERVNIGFESISPQKQKGFRVWYTPDSVHYDAWFEGKLNTVIRFASAGDAVARRTQ